MGYSHHWSLESMDKALFACFLMDCLEIIGASPIPLAGWDGTGKPKVKQGKISFNGSADRDEDYETFNIEQTDEGSSFCKTAERPYDVIVVACLCALADRLGDDVEVTSDGGRADWKEGAAFASKVLGREVEIPTEIRE